MANIKFVGVEEGIKVELVDSLGSDLSVVNAARVTMGIEHSSMTVGDAGLINFLAREHHQTPFRHPHVTLKCKAPIAIVRQLGKSQVGFQWNEKSRRYKDGDVEVFVPELFNKRPDDLHEGSAGVFHPDYVVSIENELKCAYNNAVSSYDDLLTRDLAPEQARFVLPQGMITEWVWTGSLLGWFNMYQQRSNLHAQYEVRLFAKQVDVIMNNLYPHCWSALKLHQIKSDTVTQ